jgi:uncharacterized protein with NAD-binding domain and iron-sulfur cluster
LAIVGGGPAGLVAAFHLTRNEPEAYDITIYEMSWRLGGKTASGRGEHGRIEEHGLHILFGCYHNVFHTLQLCYDEFRGLVSEDKHRIRYLSDAISPQHFGVIGDDRPTPWVPMYIEFPSNRGVPGDPPLPSIFDLVSALFQITWMVILGADSLGLLHRALAPVFDYRNRWKRRDFERPAWENENPNHHPASTLGGDFVSRALLKLALGAADRRSVLGKLTKITLGIGHWLWRSVERWFIGFFKQWWSAGDFFFALFRGIIVDDVLSVPGGFNVIDQYDLREWLKRHHAADETLHSPWMRIIYDAAFSYPKGGIQDPSVKLPPGRLAGESIAAGSALRALLLMTVTFKGAFYNKMEAGMADVIHTPLYTVLKNRGVKFEFFHRLTDLEPSEHTPFEVGQVVFDTLPEPLDYDPLQPVAGMLCWPTLPLLERIPEGSRARALQAESYAPTDAPSRKKVLQRGKDFDSVLLATPVACLPYICPSLLKVDEHRTDGLTPRLSDQHRIDTVQTVAVELWLKISLKDLGWRRASPLLSLFTDPLNTWCDMTHLLPRETWPAPWQPQNIGYFCGALPHEHEFPAPSELGRAAQVKADIETQLDLVTKAFLDTQLATLLPAVRGGQGFEYSLLVDPLNRKAEERLPAAYMRVNYEPHALCTLALPGKTQWRMSADETGFDNLFVSGDWIDNGVYVACVEGTFQSGILSARAISKRYTGQNARYTIVAEQLLNLKVTRATA